MFGPEIINQLRVVEIVLHSLRQLRLSHCNKEGPCPVLDCITRPERELALAVRFGLHISDRMAWQIELHHAGRHPVVTDQQVGMSLLASFLSAGLLLNIGQNRPLVMARNAFEFN